MNRRETLRARFTLQAKEQMGDIKVDIPGIQCELVDWTHVTQAMGQWWASDVSLKLGAMMLWYSHIQLTPLLLLVG